ncbi:MAG: hypothetical protein NC402_00965 [Prevotella sp.]|nr:hypothetical protein [Prevotella sp.]MCM1074377.1 hypothetical protein [Ruminococcus sp.]
MNTLRFWLTTVLTVAFIAMATVACDSKSKRDRDDDEDDDEKTEKVDEKDRDNKDRDTVAKDDDLSAENFIRLCKKMARGIGRCTSYDEVDDYLDANESALSAFNDSEAKITDENSEEVWDAFSDLMGEILQQAVDLDPDNNMSYDEQYALGQEFGEQIRSIFDDSKTIGELCRRMDNFEMLN